MRWCGAATAAMPSGTTRGIPLAAVSGQPGASSRGRCVRLGWVCSCPAPGQLQQRLHAGRICIRSGHAGTAQVTTRPGWVNSRPE